MPIALTIKTKITQIGTNNTPNDLARALKNQGITGIPNSDTDGIIQRYLISQGFDVTNEIIRGIKYILSTDNDVFLLPRSIAIFVILFNNYAYPALLDPSVQQPKVVQP